MYKYCDKNYKFFIYKVDFNYANMMGQIMYIIYGKLIKY